MRVFLPSMQGLPFPDLDRHMLAQTCPTGEDTDGSSESYVESDLRRVRGYVDSPHPWDKPGNDYGKSAQLPID